MRLEGWDIALAGIIKDRRHEPFIWGTHDCCLFAADCALAMTGHDFAKTFRGKYKTDKGAMKLIAKHGGFEKMITALLGEPIAITFAQRGDVAMIDQDGFPALAVCVGANLVAAGIDGLVFKPLSTALTAWRVA